MKNATKVNVWLVQRYKQTYKYIWWYWSVVLVRHVRVNDYLILY